jgi:hypothetical protein
VESERTIPILPCRQIDDVVPFYEALGSFDPMTSMGSLIWQVPDTTILHRAFSDGLRARFGRVPSPGIPRMTRPRRRQGEADDGGPTSQLDLVLRAAARQGDALGEPQTAILMLHAGLVRHAGAPAVERPPVLAYLAELLDDLVASPPEPARPR